ncbi:cyclin-dependent kinase inhibitor 1C [Mixophyes fleayi]|uniref:cyclin-dependent kinase inhibitor 1C n=1 Tax=Mixophyes fleayi TaxID=3061075 RepID=UPI003F4DF69E
MCNVQRAEGAPRPGPPVCRNLFGPVDHAELSRELRCRLREMQEESSRRWDFDFQRGVPLPSSRYVWEESGVETVPAFYRTPQCVHPKLSPPELPQGALTASTGAKRSQTALTASTGAKRSQGAAQITDFFPVRKKTKVAKALCDKFRSTSPIPTEHTPHKMCR